MTSSVPKKYLKSLPTLTEIVSAAGQSDPGRQAWSGGSEELLVQRVMQRLELTLDETIRRVIADALETHFAQIAPQVRQSVDDAVRRMVTQAIEAEKPDPAGDEAPAAHP